MNDKIKVDDIDMKENIDDDMRGNVVRYSEENVEFEKDDQILE